MVASEKMSVEYICPAALAKDIFITIEIYVRRESARHDKNDLIRCPPKRKIQISLLLNKRRANQGQIKYFHVYDIDLEVRITIIV